MALVIFYAVVNDIFPKKLPYWGRITLLKAVDI